MRGKKLKNEEQFMDMKQGCFARIKVCRSIWNSVGAS